MMKIDNELRDINIYFLNDSSTRNLPQLKNNLHEIKYFAKRKVFQ